MAHQLTALLPRPEPSQGQSRRVSGNVPQHQEQYTVNAGAGWGSAAVAAPAQALMIAQQHTAAAVRHAGKGIAEVSDLGGGPAGSAPMQYRQGKIERGTKNGLPLQTLFRQAHRLAP